MYQWSIDTRSIYHLLCRTFGQCVAVAQVIDLDISNVVAICNVHLTIDQTRAVACTRATWSGRLGGGRAQGRSNRGNVDMLDTLLGLNLGIDSGSRSSYERVSLIFKGMF